MLSLRKKIIALFLCITMISSSLILAPVAAFAQGMPVIDGTQITLKTKDTVETILLDILGGMVRTALNAILGKLAYDAAVWVASGGENQEAFVHDENNSTYFGSVMDSAGGALVEGFANGVGLDAAALCDPGVDFRLGLTIGLDVQPIMPYEPACSLTELAGNWEQAYKDADFSDMVQLQFDSTANPLGISLEAQNLTLVATSEAKDAAEVDRGSGSFKDKTELVSGAILTPGSQIEKQFQDAEGNTSRTFDTVGKPLTDALNIFASTLVSALMKKVQDGLANTSGPGALTDLVSGKGAGASRGREAAVAKFAELKQPVFAPTGSFDILAQLGACPDNESIRGVTNCAVGSRMLLAITEGWTVQEFVDSLEADGGTLRFAATGLDTASIIGDSGINEHGITLLKTYRVVPVGWQLAAEYIADSTTDEEPTLKDLVDAYDQCGPAEEDYSPFCKLVDPNWVLKAPQNFCVREAAGPTLATDPQTYDSDGSSSTQEKVIYNRLNYCADSRGCIQEEEEDVCTAYGYCTEESRIYRFDGTVCEEEYSSCQSYEDEDGDQISYLKSSLNYNDCATDPGCQWYCNSTNESGDYDCASPTETFITCSEDVANNEADYGLVPSSVDYNLNEACLCELERTCEVAAGSDRGYDPGADGVYDYWQCVITNDDATTQVCSLSNTCGAGSPTYDSGTSTCTCVVEESCDESSGDTTCTTAGGNYCEIDEGGDGAADVCSAELDAYSNAPVCDPAVTLYCGECYVNDGFSSCNTELGNTCTLTSECNSGNADWVGARNQCSCAVEDTCSIPDGAYSCTSTDDNYCVLGSIAEDPTVENDTIYFDDNVKECDSGDAGCNRYVRMLDDTNLIPNAYFDYYDEEQNFLDDENSDFIGFCTHDGDGCYDDETCFEDVDGDGTPDDIGSECMGWNQNNLNAYLLTGEYSTYVAPILGDYYIRIPFDGTDDGNLEMVVDTGRDLYNRTFTFAYSASSLQADATTCNISFAIGDADGDEVETVTQFTNNDGDTIDSYTSDWEYYYYTYTFPDEDNYGGDGDAGSKIKLIISEDAACDVDIDGAQLLETDSFGEEFVGYASSNLTYLNGDTISCEPEDVGCELYVQSGKDEKDGIPGIITNPESESCLGTCSNLAYSDEINCLGAGETWDATAYNYGNPQCSQCNGNPDEDQSDDFYKGCGFYQEVSLENNIPLTTEEAFLVNGSDEWNGVVQRYGGRCSDDNSEHCFQDNDCTGYADGATCELQLSVVPSSADRCSVSQVGCEEYTNLDAVSAGGEGLSYYTQLKQCVKTNDASIYTFHTIESSDVTGGIEIVDHLLKLDSDGGPCTSLDLESEDYNADCNSTPSADECGPAGDDVYGDDPDCRQYVNDAGDVFYRYESQVVVASESCLPLRNSQDTRVYYAIPGESTSCSASAVSCREYRGTSAADEYEVFKEAFRSNTTEGWDGATSTSNDSLFSGDYSLEMHDSSGTEFNVDISHDLFEEDSEGVVNGDLTGGNSYILTFWAKADTAGTAIFWIEGTGTDYYFTTDGSVLNSPSDASVTLDPNSEGGWQFYQLGPVILDELEDFDLNTVKFVMNFTGAGAADEAVIDSMILTESNSQYLIQDTFEYCQEFEGCREYKDRDNTKHYLKSFTRLCNDDVVGCEAMIDTQNSSHPFTEAYNLDNEYDEDDVIVHADEAVTLVYDEDNECSELVYGCSAVGLPDVDEQSGAVNEFSTKYFLDRPDSYSSILCEQPQLSCREYKSNYDGTVYFKDPGERICVLNEYTNEVGNLVTGWFKDNSTSDVPDCPKQFDYADPSQPLGGVCNSNSIYTASDACSVAGNNNESDCTADAGIWDESKVDNRVGKLCNQDGDCYPTGWSSGDPIPRCISNLDDDVDVRNGQVHQYEIYPEDDVHLASVVNDIGWVGQCKSATSGCSEYVDPYSPNIVEANKNWSFENDVRNTSNVYYDETDTPDGFPDWWVINYNATEVDTGLLDTEGDPIYANTEIDIEGDGSIDFTTTCDTTKAVQTDSSAYTGDSISPSDGASAVSLSDCILENKEFEVIERDKLYSIRVMVKLDEASFEDTEFSIGLRFYDSEGYELRSDTGDVTANQVFVVADHELMSSVASYEADAYDGKSTWYRWQSNIGLGSTVEFPENAYYARMFIANHGTSPMYFDEASFKQNDKYYYLDYTVDGTTEKEQTDSTNSCYDQDTEESSITSDGGCVSFRDVTYDTQNYSQDGLDCTNCLLTPNSDSCRGVVDACDTNTILKVKKDRVCDKWLGCITAEIVIDENGNQDVQCFELSECLALDENGQCKTWNWKVNYDDLNATHDLFYSSAPGDTDSLEAVRNLTGYVKAGMTWASNRTCEVGSPQAGQTCNENSDCYETLGRCKEFSCIGNPMTACSTDEDCIVDSSFQCQDPLRVEGYYPYGWMYEVGENGAENGKELIEYSTFEQLYCDGQQADRSVACILNASSSDYGHCYTSSMQSKIDSSDTVSVEDVLYQDDSGVGSDFNDNDADQITLAFCPNSPNFGDYWPFGIEAEYTQTGWQAMRNGDMFVSQFDTNLDCDTEACESIDVNNVLQFRADLDSGIPFSGGAEYSLSDSITPNGSYALSFDARFADTSWIVQGEDISNPTTMTICFDHTGIKDGTGTELDRKDCFVNGYGSADIVFAIDTSASMGAEITAIQQAAPALAYLLDQQGVDTRFALVDMDDRDNTSNNDEDANYIDLDFTSSICDSYNPTTNICTGGTFNNAIKALKADNATVDPFNAVYESAINSFTFGTTGSERNLDFRADTKPFVIVVTDTYDENTRAPLSGWDIGESEASAATQEVDMPAFIITDDNSVSYYSQLAGASDGQVYSYMDPDTGVTISDWANNTTIISDITANIIAGVDIFQLSNSMDHYSFGPITAEKLYIGDADEDGADADQSTSVRTNLQFLMTDGSPVQLDNISLLPVLETNKDLTPIGRTCRAYPTNDARQCVYSETNGVSYSGWKGYCLETDPDDKRRCITWYPLEAIQGETSIVTRTTAGYTGRSEVYHCMVSKGYEELGICDAYSFGSAVTFNANQEFGQGVLCTEDNDASCGSNSCMIGAFYDLPEDTDYQNNDEHNDISDGYTEQAFTNGIYTVYDDDIPYVVEPMRWQLHDPFDSAEFEWSQNGATPAYDNGIVTRIPANELMRNIHVSEIEGLVLNTGSAGDGAGDGGNSHLEYPYWGQLGFHGEIDKSGSPYDVNESYPAVTDVPEECSAFADAGVLCDEFGNWLLTDLDGGKHGGSIYNDGTDYKPWYNCAVYDESDAPGIGCRVWGTWDSEFLQKYYDDEKGDVTGMNPDLVYVWAWSNFDHGYGSGDSDSMTYDCGTGTNNREDEQRDAYKFGTLKDKPEWWFKSKCLASTIDYVIGMNSADTSNIEEWAADNDNKARNPWKHLEDSFLSTIVDEDVDNEFPKVVHFEGSETGTSDVKSWGGWQNYEDTYAARSGGGENTVNGGNIFSVWIDFNDEGYIQAVYTMVYHGAIDTEDSHVGYNRGVELTWDNSLSMKIHLRESCSLIAEAVDSRGNQVAWAARADGSDTYDMHAADDSSTFDFNYSVDSTPYGSITPQDDGPTFWDSQETGGGDEALLYEHGSFGVTPVLSYDTSELNAGHPIACIGECSTKYCSGNPTKEGVVCTDDDDCGSMGSCVGIQADNIITGNGMDTTYSNFDDQLEAVADIATLKLKHIWADILGNYYKLTFGNSCSNRSYRTESSCILNGNTWDTWLETTRSPYEDVGGDYYGTAFEDMSACNGDGTERPGESQGEEAEYCGVYPYLENISVDGNSSIADGYYDIENGRTVQLQFTTSVDQNQLPLDYIYIDWGDGDDAFSRWEASPTTHIYTHAYNCDPGNTYDLEPENQTSCTYLPKITVVDHWDWCSGSDETTDPPTSGTRNRHSGSESDQNLKTSCGTYDPVEFNIRVDATS